LGLVLRMKSGRRRGPDNLHSKISRGTFCHIRGTLVSQGEKVREFDGE
jgi:hypothetical protein